MTLQLLLTHYNEPLNIVKRMLDSIDEQLNYVNLDNFSVSIVSDGLDNILPQSLFSGYRYKIDYVAREHQGARFARNFLLREATGTYVMFCDIDDSFTGTIGIYSVFEAMKTSPDVITSPILKEYVKQNGDTGFQTIPSENAVWLGGDAFKTEYLRDNGIEFDEVLNYGEKFFLWQAFNFTSKIAYVPIKMYIYRYNVGSLSRSEQNFRIKNLYKFMGTIDLLANRLNELGKIELLKKLLSESIAFSYASFYSVWLNRSDAQEYEVDDAKNSIIQFVRNWLLYISEIPYAKLKTEFIKQAVQMPTVQKLTFDSMLEWVDDIWLEY